MFFLFAVRKTTPLERERTPLERKEKRLGNFVQRSIDNIGGYLVGALESAAKFLCPNSKLEESSSALTVTSKKDPTTNSSTSTTEWLEFYFEALMTEEFKKQLSETYLFKELYGHTVCLSSGHLGGFFCEDSAKEKWDRFYKENFKEAFYVFIFLLIKREKVDKKHILASLSEKGTLREFTKINYEDLDRDFEETLSFEGKQRTKNSSIFREYPKKPKKNRNLILPKDYINDDNVERISSILIFDQLKEKEYSFSVCLSDSPSSEKDPSLCNCLGPGGCSRFCQDYAFRFYQTKSGGCWVNSFMYLGTVSQEKFFREEREKVEKLNEDNLSFVRFHNRFCDVLFFLNTEIFLSEIMKAGFLEKAPDQTINDSKHKHKEDISKIYSRVSDTMDYSILVGFPLKTDKEKTKIIETNLMPFLKYVLREFVINLRTKIQETIRLIDEIIEFTDLSDFNLTQGLSEKQKKTWMSIDKVNALCFETFDKKNYFFCIGISSETSTIVIFSLKRDISCEDFRFIGIITVIKPMEKIVAKPDEKPNVVEPTGDPNEEKNPKEEESSGEEHSVEAKEPAAQENSVEAKEPAAQENSVEAKEPAAQENSVEVKKPAAQENPVEVKKPIEEEKSVEEEESIEEEKPVEAKESSGEEKPIEVVEPAAQENPVEVKKPIEVVEPAAQENPVEVKKPTEVVEPVKTTETKAGAAIERTGEVTAKINTGEETKIEQPKKSSSLFLVCFVGIVFLGILYLMKTQIKDFFENNNDN